MNKCHLNTELSSLEETRGQFNGGKASIKLWIGCAPGFSLDALAFVCVPGQSATAAGSVLCGLLRKSACQGQEACPSEPGVNN
jgi:hypothetical protein